MRGLEIGWVTNQRPVFGSRETRVMLGHSFQELREMSLCRIILRLYLWSSCSLIGQLLPGKSSDWSIIASDWSIIANPSSLLRPHASRRQVSTELSHSSSVSSLDQSEASIQVTWSASTNQRPVSPGLIIRKWWDSEKCLITGLLTLWELPRLVSLSSGCESSGSQRRGDERGKVDKDCFERKQLILQNRTSSTY